MNELAAALEARALAQFLKTSRWVYPLVNAGHILGIALLIGSVVPMDLRLLGLRHRPGLDETVRLLRPVAVAGLVLAAVCGVLLFITQAGDYLQNGWFGAKLALVALAVANALWHLRIAALPPARRKVSAAASLLLWPAALVCGRMIAFS